MRALLATLLLVAAMALSAHSHEDLGASSASAPCGVCIAAPLVAATPAPVTPDVAPPIVDGPVAPVAALPAPLETPPPLGRAPPLPRA